MMLLARPARLERATFSISNETSNFCYPQTMGTMLLQSLYPTDRLLACDALSLQESISDGHQFRKQLGNGLPELGIDVFVRKACERRSDMDR